MTAIILILNRALNSPLRMIMLSAIVLSLFGISEEAWASYDYLCVHSSGVSVDTNNISINTDDASAYPAGTLIGGPYADDSAVAFTFTGRECAVGSGTSTWAEAFHSAIGTYSSPEGNLPVYEVYNTVGFGYALAIGDPNKPYQGLQENPTAPLWADDHAIWYGGLGIKYKLYYVTTGPLVPGNYFIEGGVTLARVCLSSSLTTNTRDSCSILSNKAFIISVKVGGCDIDADTPALVNLERINANKLTHKGDVGDNVDFAINLTCTGTTTVNMTLTDPNGGDAENGVLYSDEGDGLAENVGIQILSVKDGGQTPQTVHLNESFTVGDATEGHYEIPMSVRYYRTSDDTIVGGKVSASVIYEISYQ